MNRTTRALLLTALTLLLTTPALAGPPKAKVTRTAKITRPVATKGVVLPTRQHVSKLKVTRSRLKAQHAIFRARLKTERLGVNHLRQLAGDAAKIAKHAESMERLLACKAGTPLCTANRVNSHKTAHAIKREANILHHKLSGLSRAHSRLTPAAQKNSINNIRRQAGVLHKNINTVGALLEPSTHR